MSKWTPQNDEPALTLAAIRWYAMSLEKLATDLYITNREMYPQVQEILSTAFKQLGDLRGYCRPDQAAGQDAKAQASKGERRWPAGRWADRIYAESAAAETYGGSQPLPQPKNLMAEDGCGPGYVNCDGVCLPECDKIAEY